MPLVEPRLFLRKLVTEQTKANTMNPETIVELVFGKPFQPFAIYLTDGRVFEIRRPEFTMVSRDHVVVGIPGEEDGVAEKTHLVSLRNITSTSPLSAAAG